MLEWSRFRSLSSSRVAALLAAAVLLGACASTATPPTSTGGGAQGNAPAATPAKIVPGITQDKITIGAFIPLSGALASSGTQFKNGAEAYFRHVNDQGGINGRKIEWIVENDEYNPQQSLTVAKKLVERDKVFALVGPLGTANTLPVVPYAVEQQVPLVGPLGSAPQFLDSKEKWVFGIVPLGITMGEGMGRYALADLNAKRIAIFFQNDQYGKDGRDGVIRALKAAGLEPAAAESHEPNATDVSGALLKIKAANPDVVMLWTTPKAGAMFLKEAKLQSWTPKFIAPNPLGDPSMVGLAGAEALEGVFVNYFVALDETEGPKVQEAVSILKKYSPETIPGYFAFNGMAAAMIFVEGARQAGADLTRESLITGLEALRDFETGLVGPITYGPGDHAGADKFAYAVWKGGKLEKVSGWR